jgi:hypothetical protein
MEHETASKSHSMPPQTDDQISEIVDPCDPQTIESWIQEEREDMNFPDEIDTPEDIPARIRYPKLCQKTKFYKLFQILQSATRFYKVSESATDSEVLQSLRN